MGQGNEMVKKGVRYVKIPQIPGRIRILEREDGQTILRSVEYIYERSRKKVENAKKGQKKTTSVNRKAIIGYEVEQILKGWMVPNENYDIYFDREGNPIPRETTEEEPVAGMTDAGIAEEEAVAGMTDAGIAEEEQETQTAVPAIAVPKAASDPGMPAVPVTSGGLDRGGIKKIAVDALKEIKREMNAKEREKLAAIPEDEMTEADRKRYEYLKDEKRMEELETDLKRLCILTDMQRHTIEAQAKKNPDGFLSGYKVRKLNQILAETRELFRGTKYEDYLELIPKPVTDENGYIVDGMTYSDATILLNIYSTALYDSSVFG